MRHIVRFPCDDTRPRAAAVLARMNVPAGAPLSDALRALLDESAAAYGQMAAPVAVFEEMANNSEFAQIYAGAGRNEPDTPLPGIAEAADALALFAGTLGPGLDAAIAAAFRDGNSALGCVLDAYASAAAERLAELTGAVYGSVLERSRRWGWFILPYSPGYCGWHLTGQARLFERLRPSEIGITLNDSSLMVPIKSVSGLLVGAMRDVHRFAPDYPFCETCLNRTCLDRMRALSRVP